MTNDLGYQKVLELSKSLSERFDALAKSADQKQADGMKDYLESQENSVNRAWILLEAYRSALKAATEKALERASGDAERRLVNAYRRYGLKED